MIARADGDRRAALGAAAVFVVAALVATQLGTWTDEEYTLATTGAGPAYALHRALTYELQAPLYFVLEAVWREANGSLWWARLPSLLCTLALFFVFRRIGRRLVPEANSLPFATLATLNPFVVFAAFEIRLYALALLLAGCMWLLFEAGFVADADADARGLTLTRIGFVAVTIAAIYVQYFLAFALVGYAVVLAVRVERRAFVPFALACAPIVLAALPLALWARGQVGGYETAGPTLAYLLRHTSLHPWIDFLFPYERDWDLTRWPRAIYDAVVGLTLASLFVWRARLSRNDWSWIAAAIAVECVYLALLAGLRLQLDDRHYVALYVPLAVAAYVVVRRALESGRATGFAVLGLCAMLTLAVLVTRYRHLAEPGDWRRVGAYLETAAKPGDAIVVYAADAAPALARQYRGDVPIVPFPATPSTSVYSVDTLVVHSPEQATRAFGALHRYEHLWFVSDVRCRSDETLYGCLLVGPAIDRDFTILGERDFYETSVLELLARDKRGKDTAQP